MAPLPGLDVGYLNLIDIRIDPNGGKIGDGVELLIGHHLYAFINVFLNDKSRVRRVKGQTSFAARLLFKLVDLLFGNIPEGESLFAGFDQRQRP